jgi:hypothetical protein
MSAGRKLALQYFLTEFKWQINRRGAMMGKLGKTVSFFVFLGVGFWVLAWVLFEGNCGEMGYVDEFGKCVFE